MSANSSKVNNTAQSKPTIGEWLRANTKRLEAASISSARLDCLILLEQRLPSNRAHMLAHLDDVLTDDVLVKLHNDIELRLQHKPVQYLTGFSEFYGRQFIVSDAVLVPRPETEDIITLLKTMPAPKTIIDVGTGSGCLAITAKLELPTAKVYALDIDEKCLEITQQNATKLGADIELLQSNLLASLSPRPYPLDPIVILANLPYVPESEEVNEAAKHEPALALYGGPDGLNPYRKLWKQIDQLDNRPSAVICESSPLIQHEALAEIAKHHGYTLQATQGLQQLFVPLA